MSSSQPREPSSEWMAASEPIERVSQVDTGARLTTHGPIASAHGSSGSRLGMRDLRRIAVWQLGEPLTRHVTGGIKDDVPSAEATPIWYFDVNGTSPENRYQDAGQSTRSMRIYHVDAFPGLQRGQIVALDGGQPGELGIPKYDVGDRVYAQFNNQSGRWEIIGPAEDVWRFELKTPLAPNGYRDVPSTAEAYLVVFDGQQGKYVTTDVVFPVADFLDIWDGDAGCRGYAKRLADSHSTVGWEVIILETEVAPCNKSPGPSQSSSGPWPLPSSTSDTAGECSACLGTTPATMLVSLGTITAGTCDDCADWTNVWSASQVSDCRWAVGGLGNIFGYSEADLPCDEGNSYIVVDVWRSGTNTVSIRVTVNLNGEEVAIFRKVVTGSWVDCSVLGSIPLQEGQSDDECDWSTAFCRLLT